MLRIEQLGKYYKANGHAVRALHNINLDIQKGQIFGIIGRSGAGKSSLLRTLNLLERPSSGKVWIEGEDITAFDRQRLHGLRQRIGMVFQHFNLLHAKTVTENSAFPLKLTGEYTSDTIQTRVEELLDLVGLKDQGSKYPAQLSGGQKQRVGIARALANYPQLLLCDEATSALDPETTQAILRLLLDINQKLGLTIVLITHEMQVIRTICDAVAVIDAGEIVETGNVVDVFLHPQHAVTQSLVAENQALDLSVLERSDQNGDQNGDQDRDRHLLRLSYVGSSTHEPIITRIAVQTGIDIAILQGVIGRIKNTPYGQLLVELRSTQEQSDRVEQLLVNAGVRVARISISAAAEVP
ncbi:methionine ABC transporter ATP-binding protein [Undibacterium sp. Di26W]|uniref:methionine ABC transporter ATP-binding protein n=1 Tax=Undibacterium sp. Di26W TaxID=3413035 RepID=UPI003BEFD729